VNGNRAQRSEVQRKIIALAMAIVFPANSGIYGF
jgi:hypothetical protein